MPPQASDVTWATAQLLYISGPLPCGNQLGINNALLNGVLTLNRSLLVGLQLQRNSC